MLVERTQHEGNELLKFGDSIHGEFTHFLPPMPVGTENMEPSKWTDTAYDDLFAAMDQRAANRGDIRLSSFAKDERELPIARRLLENPAKLQTALDNFEQSQVIGATAHLLAPPKVSESNLYASVRATEIRNWMRTEAQASRSNVLRAVSDGSMSNEAIAAILDSPVAFAEEIAKQVKTVWEERRRREHPDEFAVIDARRMALSRARRANAHIAVATTKVVGWTPDKMLTTLLQSENEYARKGIGAFGFDERRAAEMRFAMSARKAA